ncbi:ABC transporter ATP-binding protein [Paracoccus sp. PAR01]|uniref:ABC transporter ATP-binding protein n=1 Tax=Paracoccus sp. PAR01 TaxID=2769282 RepID=UPI001786B4C2|nr:ABC transporter ATP-binding protein [Paracoccus sp. PAR01]MBD9527529.1 ABC transporter ATP-binding protein [Paracoccus sp. PAR01]
MNDTTILEAVDLRKAYGHGLQRMPILDGIDFRVRKGDFVSVVGPSGCGKTTLLMALAGLSQPDTGEVRFRGQPVTQPPQGLAVVFQDYSRSLFPWKTARENVIFAMRDTAQKTRHERRDRADELLAAVGLKEFAQKYPWQLSGGMQQRVAIARGLASESDLLLLDEPLAAVDAQTRADMQDLILELAQRFDQTCLLVTHDVDEAVYMADKVIVLSRRPTSVATEIAVDLGKRRDQLATREQPGFLHARHEVMERIRSYRSQMAG